MIIINLTTFDKPKIIEHLKRLSKEDRYTRFFASVSDYVIDQYVMSIDMSKSAAFGIFDEDILIAFVHVSEPVDSVSELGISIDTDYRGVGLSQKLMDRVKVYCNTHNIKTLCMSCLYENKKMQNVARNAGMTVILDQEEAVAKLDCSPKPLDIIQEFQYQNVSIIDKCHRFNKQIINFIVMKPGNLIQNML